MKTRVITSPLLSTGISFLCVFLSACASFGPTKPNQVFEGPYPPSYYELAGKNFLLAQELGRLPELQDGISPPEATALEQIGVLYDRDPATFSSAFQQMYQVGNSEARKYCSPLQALFWLAEDGELREETNPLVDYSLVRLLFEAWKFDERFLKLSLTDIKTVLSGIADRDLRKYYSESIHDSRLQEHIHRMILSDVKTTPTLFSKEAREIIKKSSIENSRWKDFHDVIARLNAPELVDYYTKNNFHYKAYTSDFGSARLAFRRKGGNCVEIEAFQRYCLKRAGYKAFRLRADSRGKSSWATWHAVTTFYDGGRLYIMDNGTTRPKGIVGPFASVSESGYTPYIGP